MLNEAAIWNQDLDSGSQLDIQYQSQQNTVTDSDEEPLATKRTTTSQKRKKISPIKTIPDKLCYLRRQNISQRKIKKQVARKIIMRRVKEPRGTLKPMWHIVPGGTVTNYTPHTIATDTPKRKDTVIRKIDIALSTETIPEKSKLIEFVAGKTVVEYKRNREKIKKFYLDEKKQKEKQAEEKAKGQQEEPNRAQVIKDNQKVEPGHPRKILQHWSNAQNKERGRREAQKGSHNNRPNAQAHHNLT